MTRQGIQEYARAIRERYWQANKEGKTKIVDTHGQSPWHFNTQASPDLKLCAV